jgi:dTDP-4-amino-4,6-dideoxygalactose transaminase
VTLLDAPVREHPVPLDFTVAFDPRDEAEILERWQAILRGNQWSHANQLAEFEAAWSEWNGAPAVAFDNWSGAAAAILDYFNVRGETVLCPSNTFLATPRSALLAGARVEFYDCNREDLCGSFEDFVVKAETYRPKLAYIVHIGGHIAFDIHRIADYCRTHGIALVEDCAHAAGAEWNGAKPGTFGDAGIYSLYATKTISTGEGGVAVTQQPGIERHLRSYRNYGTGSRYRIQGMNHRLDEFRAALGIVQIRRLPDIVRWKQAYAAEVLDEIYPNRVNLPSGMLSGYYKYIVFDEIPRSTGKVYTEPCHKIFGSSDILPNSDWVSGNHWCVPIYYPK